MAHHAEDKEQVGEVDCGLAPESGGTRSAAREAAEAMGGLESQGSSVPGVGERGGERCRRMEEMMPVSPA